MAGEVRLEAATVGDVAAVAALFAQSRAASLPFLPVLHAAEEDRAFFGACLAGGRMTLARQGTTLAGFMVEGEGWVELLYLGPDHLRQGIGGRLLGAAQARQDELQLWCFARNAAAIAFYRRYDFIEQRRTDGDNEAGLPDILFRWQRDR